MNIEAIIFDVGGTLRERVPDEKYQKQAVKGMLDLLGKPDDSDGYLEELKRRYQSYSTWAQEHLVESPEDEIWTHWIAPELPHERIAPHAIELTCLWRNRLGRAVPRPDAQHVIAELSARGYRLGIISNTISSVDVPSSLERFGLKEYFEVIILSSTSGWRKPAPEIFWQATHAMNVQPARCAYLGDRISRDVVGARQAGFARALIIEAHGSMTESSDGTAQPDATIHALSELLEIFPERSPE